MSDDEHRDGELRAHTIRIEDDTWAETEIAAKRCGLSISEYVRRTLRDQVVKSRNLIAQGWDIEEVSARLGHASVAITQRIYVHQFDAARRSPERRARLVKLYGDDDAGAGIAASQCGAAV